MSYAGPFKRQFYISTILAITLSLLTPLRPFLVGITVDTYILGNDYNGLVLITLISLLVLFAESICKYFFLFLTNWLGQHVVKNLRVKVFSHLIGLRLSYYNNTPVGISTTRTINDLETINSVFTEGAIQIIADLLTIVFVITFMFVTNWQLTLLSLISLPMIVYATYVFKEGIKSTFQEVRTAVARLNSFLQERITGMKVVQIFNAEEQEYENFKMINKDHRGAQVRSVWYYSIFFPVVEIIIAFATALMVWRGAHSVLQGHATLGDINAFILYLSILFRPLRMLADKFNTLQMGVVSSDRIFKILDTREHIENTGKYAPDKVAGKIDFKQVWFAYKDNDWVLRDVSFQIKPGETLAIVGATGAGKTSIINILNRFYEIQQGDILIDGYSVKSYELSCLRTRTGMVLQDVFLFSGSIYENISLRDASITMEQVVEASKMLGAHEFIMRLPGGYNYNVMERGATLSLGQRQLISFIRALVFNPDILILDEATSSVDTETEQVIQHAIENLIANRTSIIIAHRLSTIQRADQILVLDKGEVKEIGTHNQLLELNGYYRKLYDMQFVKEIVN
ncbi:MAG: ABC transporter ATP-binding protein [Chitinophagales bacterium]|nr:ABC transporter ATP-binding protein [Bacteroidota bacterium]MBP8249521.1 ABC transporter ATP-binding protein [Chitinophagales bacterium]MBK9504871.1 ABC transporter ATP-binding protein [Bacteroidota bacterium]MBK9555879.1 ABC transporter ATP-binding protein [Bacteroidota bacterium]MBL0279351.1 ABC transporter ATP-binding protein [Bacteroidota bacterium]